MIKLIKKLLQQTNTIGNCPLPNTSDTSKNRVRHRHTNVSKYYLSHGACACTGRDCIRKRQGHKDAMMFGNKMSGSMYYYQAESVNPNPL